MARLTVEVRCLTCALVSTHTIYHSQPRIAKRRAIVAAQLNHPSHRLVAVVVKREK